MDEILSLFLGEVPPTPKVGQRLSPVEAMRLALAQAWQGIGRVSPNPMVGCVIVSKDDRFLAKGFHARAGEMHAEIAALADLADVGGFLVSSKGWDLESVPKEKLKQAKIYVTLEPCAHVGRTPSCAKTLSLLPIKELIYGLQDPNPLVAGRGAEILKAAGIDCRPFEEISPEQPLRRELVEVCEHFILNVVQQRPFVALKVASSLDGIFALKSGESQWITGEKSRSMGHFFRGVFDAMLVGRGTIERDNPALNIRHTYFEGMEKKLVVVDTHGSLLRKPELKIFKVHSPQNLIWAVGEGFQGEVPKGIRVIRVPADERGLDLGELQKQIWSAGIRSLYIEGGGKTLSAHLRSQTADRLILFQSPILLGALGGRAWSESFGVESLKDQVQLESVRRLELDRDQLLTGRLQYNSEHAES